LRCAMTVALSRARPRSPRCRRRRARRTIERLHRTQRTKRTRHLCSMCGTRDWPAGPHRRYTRSMATAVIDIGTNTLLLLIVDEAMHPLADLCRFGRLGKGLDATGRLAADAI